MGIDPKTMEKIKEKQLEILTEFDEACKTIGLRYSLAFGTLLGAERHGGYIPWDDDVDIFMLRDDYEKFLELGPELLPENLFIQNYETEENYHNNFSKIINTSTTLKEPVHDMLDISDGVFIDVFPIDAAGSRKSTRLLNNLIICSLEYMRFLTTEKVIWNHKKPIHIRLIRLFFYNVGTLLGNFRLNKLETYIRKRNNTNDNNFTYCRYRRTALFENNMLDAFVDMDIFKNLKKVEFESRTFKAIEDTEQFLSLRYGEDYMELPPKEERVSRHEYVDIEID